MGIGKVRTKIILSMKKDTKEAICPEVKATLKAIGGKWKPLVLWHLNKQDVMRFGELKKNMSGITQKMLTKELRELESDRIIKRKVYPQVPPKVEYSITEYGKSLRPVIKEMYKWGKEHSKV